MLWLFSNVQTRGQNFDYFLIYLYGILPWFSSSCILIKLTILLSIFISQSFSIQINPTIYSMNWTFSSNYYLFNSMSSWPWFIWFNFLWYDDNYCCWFYHSDAHFCRIEFMLLTKYSFRSLSDSLLMNDNWLTHPRSICRSLRACSVYYFISAMS